MFDYRRVLFIPLSRTPTFSPPFQAGWWLLAHPKNIPHLNKSSLLHGSKTINA
jgi:hypothetical protein